MILFKKADDLSAWLREQRDHGKDIGFVPTMGALHAGHISLINTSKNGSSRTVCSIFVNPTQFNDPKDFQKYPVTIEKDIYLLEKAGTDVLFLPSADEVYPGGTTNLESYDLGPLESLLEGKYRPGHFQGVCQVMQRLLALVRPDHLYMGQKDYQQCMVVQRLLDIMGSSTILYPCPIIREPDGLAMSSRNLRLTDDQRKRSTAIYKALISIKEAWATALAKIAASSEIAPSPVPEKMDPVLQQAASLLEDNQFRIDYISLADAVTLEPLTTVSPIRAVALIAAFQGEIRLIDNLLLT